MVATCWSYLQMDVMQYLLFKLVSDKNNNPKDFDAAIRDHFWGDHDHEPIGNYVLSFKLGHADFE